MKIKKAAAAPMSGEQKKLHLRYQIVNTIIGLLALAFAIACTVYVFHDKAAHPNTMSTFNTYREFRYGWITMPCLLSPLFFIAFVWMKRGIGASFMYVMSACVMFFDVSNLSLKTIKLILDMVKQKSVFFTLWKFLPEILLCLAGLVFGALAIHQIFHGLQKKWAVYVFSGVFAAAACFSCYFQHMLIVGMKINLGNYWYHMVPVLLGNASLILMALALSLYAAKHTVRTLNE